MPSRAPTTDKFLAHQIERGEICSECSAEFVKPHGEPTACLFCWSRLPLGEREFVKKAVHDEADVERFKTLARNRKRERSKT